jgi:tRNA threonylcarbamoyladenosine biosynthesis protein TsaB
VLGFDTSSRATAVGLRLADGSTRQARDDPAAAEHPGHATRLLKMCDELLERAGIDYSDLGRIAVGLGPGRFTGLRVGVATARGLAQSLPVQAVGVSSLRALAESALASSGGTDRVLAVIDALRGEAFVGGFAATAQGPVCELEVSQPLSPQQLGDALSAFGGGPGRVLAVGDGAVRFRAQLESAGADVPADASPLHLVDPRAVCELGERAAVLSSYQQLVPDYRRRPDAELAGAARGTRPATELQAASR